MMPGCLKGYRRCVCVCVCVRDVDVCMCMSMYTVKFYMLFV